MLVKRKEKNGMDDLNSLPINILDIAVIIVLLISALFAYARGFAHEVLSVAGWIGAIFATFYGFPHLKPYVREWIAIELAADLTAGVIIFIISLIVLSYISRSISKLVQGSMLNALDRALGFLFGLVRGAVIVCLLYIGVEVVLPEDDRPDWLTTAKSMDLIQPGSEKLRTLLPEHASVSPAADAARDTKQKAKDLLGASEAVRNIIAPKPKGDTPKTEGAYGRKERQDMERLIDSSQSTN
jgi:membrane protein required for colicin V production